MPQANEDDRGFTRQEIERRRNAQQRLTLDADSNSLSIPSPGHTSRERRLDLLVLGSGSKGNAAIVRDRSTDAGILIDAGICKRDVFGFSEQGGFSIQNLKGIFISHAHSDHVKNLGVILRGLRSAGVEIPLFVHEKAFVASKELQRACDLAEVVFVDGDRSIGIGALSVTMLPTSHDTDVSFGFRVDCGDDALGFITDTGIILPEALEALRGVRILGLESNHDEKMLKEGPYPRMLKERVASERGHLSNAQAAVALEALLDDRLETVVALHISENNNTYRLPVEALRSVVARYGATVQVTCAYQQRPVFILS